MTDHPDPAQGPPGTALRQTVKADLPALLEKAAADYRSFAGQAPPTDAKGFAAHQAACKAALAHLEAGLKLLAWAEDAAPAAADDLAHLIRAAEAAVADAAVHGETPDHDGH